MGNNKKIPKISSKNKINHTPVFVGIGMIVVSVLAFFIVKSVTSSCREIGCAFAQFGRTICYPTIILALIYGFLLIVCTFVKKYFNPKKLKNESVYSFSFRLSLILMLIAVGIPWLITVLRS